MTKWTYLYGKNTIEVVYSGWVTHELYVNGLLQDRKTAFNTGSVTLQGELKSGEVIHASFGESISELRCTLYVNDELLQQNTQCSVKQKDVQQTPVNQVTVKEVTIIKEVVKIPCPYCSQFFDITMDKCPECGAKNTYYKR